MVYTNKRVIGLERKQFTFYRSYYDAVKVLPKKEQVNTILAICAYALDGIEPDLSGTANAIFTLIRPTLDASKRKAESGFAGGKSAKQTGSKLEANRKQNGSKAEAIEQTSSKIEGEKENKKEKEKEIEIEDECLIPGRDSAVAAVISDYMDRVNPSASQTCLESLASYARSLGPSVCKRAFDIALDAKAANWNYVKAILQSWTRLGVKCLADIDRLDTKREAKPYGETGRNTEKFDPKANERHGYKTASLD